MFDLVVHRCNEKHPSADVALIDDRLKKLEEGKGSSSRDVWEILQIVFSILSPIALLGLGYFLTGRLELTLKEQQARVGSAKEMQSLILQIVQAGDKDKASEAAVALAAYGDSSIEPLMNLLRSPALSVAQAAKEGLLSVGAERAPPVCARVESILNNRTRLYTWEEHQRAVEITATLNCATSEKTLRSYQKMLDAAKMETFKSYVSPNLPLDQDNFMTLHKTVTDSIALLEAAHRSAGP